MSKEYQMHFNRALELLELEIESKENKIKYLEKELKEVQDKYNKLLIFGVSCNNERLKGTK